MCLAIPMKVVELKPPHMALVEEGGVTIEVSCQLANKVAVGDYVLIHAGFVLEVMDSEAAEETLKLLDEIAKNVENTPNSK